MSRVAVLIPVFANQRGLDRTMSSLRAAAGDFDVVVVDDGSLKPIRVPASLRSGVPVRILRLAENGGIAAALNYGLGFALARGYEYVARLDSGDTVVPSRFEKQIAFLDSNPSCAVVSSAVEFVDAWGEVLFRYRPPLGHTEILKRLRWGNCLMHPAAVLRVAALREVGLYREDVLGAEDYELFLRMSGRFHLAALPEALTHMEYSQGGLSVAGRRRQQRARLRLQVRYLGPLSADGLLGIARTLFAMLVPHEVVFRLKRAYMR